MYKIRTTKTGSGNTAVQIVHRAHAQTKIIKHMGTARDSGELHTLRRQAEHYITTHFSHQLALPNLTEDNSVEIDAMVDRLSFTKTYHLFAYEFLSAWYCLIGFDALASPLLKDLAIMRTLEPASKLRSVSLLQKYFGISYEITSVYEMLPVLKLLKTEIEAIAVSYAKRALRFDFSVVFYDVTTLYFETFTEDEDTTDAQGNIIPGLKKNGFGKERKPGQPQILIGLIVNTDGFPIGVEIFSGKTFEGHTILPVIEKLKRQYGITTMTIVADAAMLSLDNMEAIKKAELTYIVGARLGNIPEELLKKIASSLNKTEGIYYTKETARGLLLCDYSRKRAVKDRADRKKQLQKAEYQIKNPGKTKRRTRFVKEETETILALNEALIHQDELREGIKGYYTNLTLTEEITANTIISRYKDLWHVEKSFRISKSDLAARPIFHRKKDSIQTHIIIVFVSLCIAKALELEMGLSLQKVKDMLWEIEDIEFVDTTTKKTYRKRMDTGGNILAELLKQIQEKYGDSF